MDQVQTITIMEASRAIRTAFYCWENAAYRTRHVLAWYGSDTRPYRSARNIEVAAWHDLRRAVPAGPEWHRVTGLLGDKIVGWNEQGELEVRDASEKGEGR